MKTVFTNSEIFHVFNEQKRETGRNPNRNIFFENNKIYSYGYHYLLGEFINENTIVINNTGYSNTTAKHISMLINATRDKKQFFTEQVDAKKALINLENWVNKLPRATKNKDIYLLEIDNTLKKYIEFIEYTQGVKIPIIEAKRLLNLIENKSILGAKVDERYTVTSFNNILKVGCHNIDIKEIEYIKNLI